MLVVAAADPGCCCEAVLAACGSWLCSILPSVFGLPSRGGVAASCDGVMNGACGAAGWAGGLVVAAASDMLVSSPPAGVVAVAASAASSVMSGGVAALSAAAA